jgi:hypothetical protein
MTYVTGAAILTHVGKSSPTAADTAWAGLCADAIEAAIAARLDGETPTAGGVDELEVAALSDGAALFNSRAAPHGVLSIGPDGDAVRLGADSLRAVTKVLTRVHSTAGYGIA